MSCQSNAACLFPESSPLLMARISTVDNNFEVADAKIEDVDDISYTVTDTNTSETSTPMSLDVADVMYDTLQKGDVWTVDSVGFNFAHTLPSIDIPGNNTTYVVEYTIVFQSGMETTLQFTIQTKKRYS